MINDPHDLAENCDPVYRKHLIQLYETICSGAQHEATLTENFFRSLGPKKSEELVSYLRALS
jgi:hypothetical protein